MYICKTSLLDKKIRAHTCDIGSHFIFYGVSQCGWLQKRFNLPVNLEWVRLF